jgi:hypothetical protein
LIKDTSLKAEDDDFDIDDLLMERLERGLVRKRITLATRKSTRRL